ncbi:hypothetical protein P154DRAFT_151590 [Amniculicola lignicola CBS 123094]|uniref:Probable treble clef zinc finger fungi domain-containing protein n=1 Tax=Amniculicola lignicola CBS 123094 TaxID=1392246 RepID=A0A6A5WKX8_9PLEO|nr:hypothetical protein P154DRAFT_151590 [Amniculicola lignicola CBS 123094]
MAKKSMSQHGPDCKLHSFLRPGRCIGIKCNGDTCNIRTRVVDTLFRWLPGRKLSHLCPQHQDAKLSYCRRREECGARCNRLSVYEEPYHPCSKHREYIKNFKFPFTELPTELRQLVLRNMFPREISARWGFNWIWPNAGTRMAVMLVSKSMKEDAEHVLHSAVLFEAEIWSSHTWFLNKCWKRDRVSALGAVFDPHQNTEFAAITQRIRRWRVSIRFSRHDILDLGLPAEFNIYAIRASISRFVRLIDRPQPAKTLKYQALVVRIHYEDSLPARRRVGTKWGLGDMMAFGRLVADPFTRLSGKVIDCSLSMVYHIELLDHNLENPQFDSYIETWKTTLRNPPPQAPQDVFDAEMQDILHKAELEYDKIDDFVAEYFKVRGSRMALFNTPALFHLARFTRETGQVEYLKYMQQRIKQRCFAGGEGLGWDDPPGAFMKIAQDTLPDVQVLNYDHSDHNTQRGQQQSKMGTLVGNLIDDMEPHERIPPNPKDEGVIFREDSIRQYFKKGGQVWIRLKTPALVRELEEGTA